MGDDDKDESRRTNDRRVWDLLHDIDKKTTRIETKLELIEKSYVTRAEFIPVQRLVYGLVAVVLMSFVGGVLSLIFLKGS